MAFREKWHSIFSGPFYISMENYSKILGQAKSDYHFPMGGPKETPLPPFHENRLDPPKGRMSAREGAGEDKRRPFHTCIDEREGRRKEEKLQRRRIAVSQRNHFQPGPPGHSKKKAFPLPRLTKENGGIPAKKVFEDDNLFQFQTSKLACVRFRGQLASIGQRGSFILKFKSHRRRPCQSHLLY